MPWMQYNHFNHETISIADLESHPRYTVNWKQILKKQIPEQVSQHDIIYVNIIYVIRVHLCTCVYIHDSKRKEKYVGRYISNRWQDFLWEKRWD